MTERRITSRKWVVVLQAMGWKLNVANWGGGTVCLLAAPRVQQMAAYCAAVSLAQAKKL